MRGQERLHTVHVETRVMDAVEVWASTTWISYPCWTVIAWRACITRADVARQLQLREDLDI